MAGLLRNIVAGLPLVVGVTFVSFLLMVHFGPDMTYQLVGKNATPEQIAAVRHALGYDLSFPVRYAQYVTDLARLDFGNSFSTGENIAAMLARAIPVSLQLVIPGFVLGNLMGVLLALLAASRRGAWPDKIIMAFSVVGMSISFPIVIIGFQILLSSAYGLDLFPVRGWNTDTFTDYVAHVTVPTMAIIFVSLGYNTRFYRAVVVEELDRDYARTARAYGAPQMRILAIDILRNCLVPISTRVLFSLPLVVIGGSLLLESYFGVPGIGKITFDAITAGDQPVLKAVVGLTAVLFVVAQVAADALYRAFDPRVALP